MNDAELAVAAVEAGAAVVRRHFGTGLTRRDKGGGDFSTEADTNAEEAMLALLRMERPGDAIQGEESGRTGADSAARVWFVDPLCGTLNYAARMRVVAVNIALRIDGQYHAAAVADPFNDEIAWTDGITGSLRSNGQDHPLVPDATSKLVDLNLDPPFSNAPAFKAAILSADPEFAAAFRPRVVSSTLALAWMATGQRAAYVTDGDLRGSVHFAAGLALCAAASCALTDLRGQKWGRGATGLIAAADASTHAVLLRLVRKYLN